MTGPDSVLVVGASAAGLSTAEALRRRGFTGRLTLVGEESWAPYDRPPLSQQVLGGTIDADRIMLRRPGQLAGLDLRLVLDDPAVALDPANRTVTTRSGRRESAEAVVVATGARARRLPGQEKLAGVHVLRTLDDALDLMSELHRQHRLVVIGDGLLGMEAAATARTAGAAVTVIGRQDVPMVRQLGRPLATELSRLHRERGVDLLPGTAVHWLQGRRGRVSGVHVEGDQLLEASLVLVAAGAQPATGWLAGSGLTLDDGVVCDATCRAADGIYAVGDVARWYHQGLGGHLRLGNRTNATEQAAAVADAILGQPHPYQPVPYFWTDQYEAALTVHGIPGPTDQMEVVEGSLADRRFVARYTDSHGATTAVVGWGLPEQTRLHREALVAHYSHAALQAA